MLDKMPGIKQEHTFLGGISVPDTVLGTFNVKLFDPYNNSRTHHHHYLTREETEAQAVHRPSERQSWDSGLRAVASNLPPSSLRSRTAAIAVPAFGLPPGLSGMYRCLL